MSVVGFDVGTQTSKVAVAKNKGIDVVTNDVSSRETPTMVGFGSAQRAIGEAGQTQYVNNWKNTASDLTRLLGLNYSEVQNDLPFISYDTLEGPDGRVLIKMANNEEPFTPEALMGAFLGNLKATAENALSTKVQDCVITVPGFYTIAQRRAMMNAAKVTDLNPLRIVNSLTAAALNYGFYKTDIDEEHPSKVMFIDMGAAGFQVSVVAFGKDRLDVLGSAYDKDLGGRNFDAVLLEHFMDEFKSKVDIRSNRKARLRLRQACEKLKKMLGSNNVSPLNVESIMDDKDVEGLMQRDVFLAKSASLLARIPGPINEALRMAKMTRADLNAVEIVGSGLRIPAVREAIEAAAGMTLSNTMNNSECICRGAALLCAQLSPVIRVREYKITDCQPFPIAMSWEQGGSAAGSSEVFPEGNAVPSSKMLTFYRSKDFEVTAAYTGASLPNQFTNPQICKFKISGFPAQAIEMDLKVRIKVRLDPSGFIAMPAAHIIQEVKEEESAEAASSSTPAPAAATPASPAGSTPGGGEDGEGEGDAEAAADAGKKRKTIKTELKVTEVNTGMDAGLLQFTIEREAQYVLEDRIVRETADARNKVEAYVYEFRNKIAAKAVYGPYISDAGREFFMGELEKMEEWLYSEDGEAANKKTYEEQLAKLKATGDPVVARYREEEERPAAVATLRASLALYRDFVTSQEEKFAHITPEARAPVATKVAEVDAWLNAALVGQAAQPQSADPVIKVVELVAKGRELDRICSPVLRIPKPAPPKVETPPPASTSTTPPPSEPAAAAAQPEPATIPEVTRPMDLD